MKRLFLAALLALFTLSQATIQAKVTHILPKPQKVTQQAGAAPFALGRDVTINYSNGAQQCALLEEFFTANSCNITANGATVNVALVESIAGAYDYALTGYENEAYTLEVTANSINITAVTATGIIRAAQTLTQIAEGYEAGAAAVEAVSITDWPAFKLRGYMHDVGRSYIPADELIKQIKLFSRFKINTFHWHLTENQAWRFEVKAYPELTESENMTRFEGSYYTQAECKELMAVAKKHGVVVSPEIDMPGHSEAFTHAMGFNMQSEEGKAVLKKVLDEVAEVFADAPYIHIGGDEVSTTAAYLNEMIAYVKSKGKEGTIWNPINGISQNDLNASLTQMWGTRGYKATGKANIDCRYNYTNHFDVFADLVGIYKSNIYYEQKGNAEVAGAISGCWNDRKMATVTDIMAQNNVYANVIATAERAWMGGGKQYIDNCNNGGTNGGGGVMLPNSGEEYDEFADWERRFLFHKANSLMNEPIPYVKQTNIRWRITDAFPNGGNTSTVFPPEEAGKTASTALMAENFTHNGNTYYTGMATGAGIYLSHTWGNSIINAYYNAPTYNNTAYAWTYVYSDKEQEVGAQIEFQNYSRSEQDPAPSAGNWDLYGSKIWINGNEIAAPAYQNTGVSINSKEVTLKNENFAARKPIKVTLKKGWNKVFLKLPYVNAGYRLDKWMFTFVLTDTEGVNAVDGLIYSPNQCLDEATELVAAKISEIKRNRGALIGTAIGLWPETAATAIDAKVAEIEATYSTAMTEEERAAQITALEAAWDTFTASLTESNMNKPVSGNYYRMYTPLRGSRYATGNGTDAAITGPTEATTKASIWRFVTRNDGSYNIINLADGTYISPASNNNTALKTVANEPNAGWTIKKAKNTGNVIVVSNTVQFNQQKDGNLYLLNWGSGTNTTDDGCQYRLVDVTENIPPQPFATITGISGETYPYAIDSDVAAEVFAKKDITIAIDVTMPSSMSDLGRQILVGAADPTQAPVTSGIGSNPSPYVGLGLNGSNLAYMTSSRGGDIYTQRGFSFTASTNYKIVFVLDKTNNTVKSYVNGGTEQTNSLDNQFQDFAHLATNDATKDNAKIYIGAGVVNNTTGWDVFAGNVRSVQFFDEALTPAKIAEIEYPVSEEDAILNSAAEANANINIFGLQRFYGLVTNAGTGIAGDGQFICNYPAGTNQESGNAYANLIDGVYTTFFHSGYGASLGTGKHYLQATLNKPVKSFRFYFKKRSQNNVNRPTGITIQGSNDGNTWENITTINSGFPSDASVLDYYSDAITTETAYRMLRFTVNSTNGGTVFYTFSEFYILPNNTKVSETFDAVRNYRSGATVETATALCNSYAWNEGLTNGVPIVGRDHYIYVDTYKDGAFLNRYLYNNNGTLTLNTTLQKNADNYTWTAAVESDGKYNFKNKAGKYLAHKGMSDNKHNFTVAKSTRHHGVSLHTQGSNYFVVKNADGGFDQSSVTYDQTTTNYCTDFVFIPTDVYSGNELSIVCNTNRANAVFTWNGIEFTSSVMFESNEVVTVPELGVKQHNKTYKFEGFYSDAAYTQPITQINELTDDKTIYAKFSLNVFSAQFGEKMVRMSMYTDNNYTAGVSAAENGAAGTTQVGNIGNAGEVWYLVGTAEGFKLQNLAAGEQYALNVTNTNEATAATMVPVNEATTWKVIEKNNSFAIVPSNAEGMTLNAYGGKGYNLKLYRASDTGGWWVLDYVSKLTINFTIDGTQPLPTNTRVSEITLSYNSTSANVIVKQNEESKVLYLPVDTKFSLTQPWLYHGYLHNGFFEGDDNEPKDFANCTIAENGLTINAKYSVDYNNKYQYLYWYRDEATNAPYRIPAITVTNSGKVLAISDFRTCGDDIGMGEVDIMFRRSTNTFNDWDGISWTNEDYVADGQGGNNNVFNVGFGDAAVVSDRESNKTLVMAVAGKQRFNWASSTSHNSMARIVTIDDGDTWEISDVTNDFMIDDDALFPTAYSMFFTSGRILQSSYKKEGANYYRLYSALVVNDNGDGSYPNYVVYSDDFGETWSILGGAENGVACSAGNETKVEELPNGDIMVSVRRGGGRYFNVFSFTDKATGSGTWDNVATSNFGASDCNGELLRIGNVLLQSIPKRGYQGKDRSNVAIYYKVIDNRDYTAADIATGWSELYQVSYIGSAYSTMTLLPDGKTLAFLYEEDPDDGTFAYNIVYVPLDLTKIMSLELQDKAFGPRSGNFYRIQGKASGNYINAAAPYNAASGQMSMTSDGTTATTIFYLTEDSKLLSYSEGTYTNGTRCIGGIGASNGQAVEFNNSEGGHYGYYTLYTNYSGSKYMYDNNNRVDRNGDYADSNCDWKVNIVTALPVTIGSAGYSTLYAPVALEIPVGVIAYTAAIDRDYINLYEVENVIPKNTAVILKANAGTYNFNISTDEVQPIENNALLGTVEKTATNSIENPYTLQTVKDGDTVTGVVMRSYTGTYVNGFRMYMSISNAAGSLGFRFPDGTTGIVEILANGEQVKDVYDLTGRKVTAPTKGLYIVNGKKVYIK